MKHLKTFESLKDDEIFVAIYNNDLNKIKELIKHNVDINAVNMYSNTALIYAAIHNYIDSLKILIEAGADWNIKNDLNTDFIYYLNSSVESYQMV